ncbi:bacillithiol system redox-active protein YtxJ [Telluribacter sp.]|jgi:bacillithiol system protein YtxJ|uniref:bacillithiol system redox-active protein YtxJ n=1 Tax=Telluribacter sp. TaxID=1978767 RepID=UPI002E0FA213|nr:bacillithiol system redox-active protein YtxJ [Telluribacter sp.]
MNNWTPLENEAQLAAIEQESHEYPVLIFKHSTRCSISATTWARLERNWKKEEVGDLQPYYLDLISFRSLSNRLAQAYAVEHESPQVLLISRGECVYNASHFDISFDTIRQQVNAIEA